MLDLLETPLTVLHVAVCLFLILVVLIQPGKSGGLGGAFGGAGATQVFGGRGAGNFLSRTTWICAGLFFLTSMVLAFVSSSTDDSLAARAKPTTAEVHRVDLEPAVSPAPEPGAGVNAPDPSGILEIEPAVPPEPPVPVEDRPAAADKPATPAAAPTSKPSAATAQPKATSKPVPAAGVPATAAAAKTAAQANGEATEPKAPAPPKATEKPAAPAVSH